MLFYAGVFALIGLCASVALGLVATDRMFLTPGHRVLIQSAHRAASFGAVTFLIIHIVTEILAQRVHVLDAVVPFLSPFRTFYIGLGTIASDLVILLVITGIMRGRFNAGGKAWRWRAIHYTSYASFVFGVWHGLLAGRPGKPYVDWSYGFLVALVLLGLAVRVFSDSLKPKENLSAPPVPESAGSASAPMRAAAMFAQLAASRRQQRRPERRLRRPAGAVARRCLPPCPPGAPAAGQGQPYYEPGYEGPPRYLGAPRASGTGPMPRASTGPLPIANTGPLRPYMGGSMPRVPTGPLPLADTGPLPPYASGPMPRVPTGPFPVAGTGHLPPYPSGPMPRVPTGPLHGAADTGLAFRRTRAARCRGFRPARCRRPGTGYCPPYPSGPMPRVPTGPMPVMGPVPPSTISGPIPMPPYASGPVPRVPTGPLPAAGTGYFPPYPSGPMPRVPTGPLPAADTGYLPPYAGGPMPYVPNGPGAGPMPQFRPATGPMPRATGPLPQAGGGRPAAWDAGTQPRPPGRPHARAADGPRRRGGTGPTAQDGPRQRPATGPLPRAGGAMPSPGPSRRQRRMAAGPGWQSAGYDGSRHPAEPPWDDLQQTDPNLRYREPGPGMPGYRGSREYRYGGDAR